jgi:hypothetical protein
MRFGIVLPCHIFADYREANAGRSFDSLAMTSIEGLLRPVLLFVMKPGERTESIVGAHHFPQFDRVPAYQPENAKDVDAAVAYGFEYLVAGMPFLTHILHVCDDFVYNPNWLIELQGLIERHPDGIAWSVYRSGYKANHWTMSEHGDDLKVNSISSTGAITAEEWRSWGIDYRSFPRDSMTLDILHGRQRTGDRWVTRKSYVQQLIGQGVHSNPACPDQSLEFVGEVTAEGAVCCGR